MSGPMSDAQQLQVYSDAPRGFQLVPVRDDGFAPLMRVGEFAVVDTTNREPEVTLSCMSKA